MGWVRSMLRPSTLAVLVLGLVGGGVLLPMVVGVLPREGWGDAAGAPPLPRTLPLFLNSVLASSAVGVLATLLGIVAAWGWRRAGRFGVVMLAGPLLLPGYLTYAGWGLLRAPGTWLGNAIGRLPGARAGEVSRGVDAVLAVLGLSLWVWPLVAVLLLAHGRRIHPDLRALWRHEPMRVWMRGWLWARMFWRPLTTAFLLVGLVVMGTAVPLHLANVPTLAIRVWLLLDQMPPEMQWRAHVAAWPLWACAFGMAWWIGGRASAWATGGRPALEEPATTDWHGGRGLWGRGLWGRGVGGRRAGAGALLLCSVGVPLGLLAFNVRDPGSFLRFWRLSGDGVVHGMAVGACAGGVGVVIAAAMSAVMLHQGRWGYRAGVWALRILLALGLGPGVLVGTGLVMGWNRLDPSGTVTGTVLIEVMAQIARYGWIGALGGCVIAKLEHPALRDVRVLDGVDTLWGFWRTTLMLHWGVLIAIGGAIGLLSFHEIEASVVVQPPGPANLPRQILNYLHFARVEEMCAAAAWLIGGGVVVLVGIGCVVRLGARTPGESK